MKSWKSLLALVASCAIAASAFAQSYPTRSIKMIVPFAAGGSTDIIARFTAAQLTKDLGQAVVVENVGGAAGALGTMQGMNAAPDGYTLLIATVSTMIVYPAAHPKPQYTLDNFVPITNIASMPNIITVTPSFPAKDLKEFIAVLKANPDKYSYATSGVGSLAHLTAVWALSRAEIGMLHVPYAVSQSFKDVLTGEVPFAFTFMGTALPLVRSGQLKAIAVTSRGRSSVVPDVPSLHESGLPEFESMNWIGLFAPAGTPSPIVARLRAELAQMASDPEIVSRLRAMGFTPVSASPIPFAEEIRRETRRWGEIVKAADLRIE